MQYVESVIWRSPPGGPFEYGICASMSYTTFCFDSSSLFVPVVPEGQIQSGCDCF